MIDFIAKLEGMPKTSGCEDYEIQYLPRGQAFCIMREWEKFSTNYIRKKAEVITFAASKSRTFSLIF